MATDLLNAGMGDVGRLQFIKECIQNKKTLYNTDEKYLRGKYQEFETKLEILSGGKQEKKSKIVLTENDLDKIVDEALAKENKSKNIIIHSKSKRKSVFKRLFDRK